MDVLSDVLKMIRLEGALFLDAEFQEPWCVETPRGAELARILQPNAQSLAICHLVLEGRCWVQLTNGSPVALHPGDVAVFPHGDAHLIGSGLHHTPVNIDDIVHPSVPKLLRVRYGGSGARAVIVCGWFAYERDVPNPLIGALPRLFRTQLGKRASGAWIEQSIRYSVNEAAAERAGSSAVAAKAAELLFLEALRGHMEAMPPGQNGWLAGLSDPQIGRCLAVMHAAPAHPWTVDKLAQEIHVSRSVLAERFVELVGIPPMHYLRRWRLTLAGRLLTNEHTSLTRIAEVIGYESQAAFSRAFRSEYGVAPGRWRRGIATQRER